MTKDKKNILYTVIGAFFLSFVIGLSTRNPFGIIVFRALVSAVLFGALIYCGVWVLKRYVPQVETAVVREKQAETEGKKAEPEAAFRMDDTVTAAAASFEGEKPGEPLEALASMEGGETETAALNGTKPGASIDSGEAGSLPSLESLFLDEEDTVPDYVSEPEPKPDSRRHDDHISVGSFRIPYEPETLAKAIKKVMSQDEGR
jgi:hypothetical protein